MQDLRLAIRALRATPIITAVATLSLALGIGANTAIFSLVNSLLLRSLPVRDAEQLVALSTGPTLNQQQYSYRTFEQVRQHTEMFDGALAWAGLGQVTLTYDHQAHTVDDAFVSGDYFTTLGVPALLGRTFTPDDDLRAGGRPVAVISYHLWQQQFGGLAAVVGQQVTIERALVTIVGVTPPDFFGVEVGRAFDVALPLHTFSLIRPVTLGDDVPWLHLMVRLKLGQSIQAATAALHAVQPAIRSASMPRDNRNPEAFLKEPWTLDSVRTGVSPLRLRFQQPLLTILIVAALVLVIAAANLANLMLARGVARRHEFSVRLALGASRWRLTRQLVMESAVLACGGTLTGLVCAEWASRGIVSRLSTVVNPVVLDVPLDWRVLAFSVAAMMATTVLSGMAPAVRAMRVPPMDALKEHGRTASDRGHLSNGLVVAQVALSLTLVVAAGLFAQTFQRLARVPLGFDRQRVLVITLSTPTVRAADRNRLYHQLVKAAAGVQGVAAAGGSLSAPLISQLQDQLLVTIPGTPVRPEAERTVRSHYLTPGWLASYGTAMRAGRDIEDRDRRSTAPILLINEVFARQFFPNQNPMGHTVVLSARFGPVGEIPVGSMTVAGVVGNAVYSSLREPAPPTVYLPLAQADGPINVTNFYLGVRSAAGSPMGLARALTAALTAVNPDVNLGFRPLAEQVDESLAQDRLVATLSGFFGGLALVLAALGLYGVTAYATARRCTELGIRMALGARPAGVVRLVLVRVFLLVGIGIAIGAGVSVSASRLVASLLYGLEPRDPATLVGAAVTLAAVGAIAGWLPAWRASRIDPAAVLRVE